MSLAMILRLVGAVLFALGAWAMLPLLAEQHLLSTDYPWLPPLLGGVLGGVVAPYLTLYPYRWARERLRQIPPRDLLVGMMGLCIGLVIALLMAVPLSLLPGYYGQVAPFVASVILGYLGAALTVMHARELFALVRGAISGRGNPRGWGESQATILDTSAIIDGRIADISQTGFVQGTLVIPRFVLDELQHIADSPDLLRRNRGRRGLDMLNKLQKESDVPIQISDADFDDVQGVDSKLVKLAKSLRAPIVTNDFNLNRVAELQGVRVLNVNLLANAVKSVVLPGEEMEVQIIQEGKEYGQGVAFLDDGTMVVVDGGKRFLNRRLEIVVTRVLTTAAGRMIFAHPKNGVSGGNSSEGRR